MLVKALCTIHDSNGWHKAGDVFETDADLGDAVEAVKAGAEKPKAEPEAPVEAPVEAPAEEPKPKSTRRKKVSE